MPSGSGSGSGEGNGGGIRWTDLFGSSSTGNSEASVNQPAPAAPEAEVYQPLQEAELRRQELFGRLLLNTVGRPLSDEVSESILDLQFQMELKMEIALRSDRFTDASLISKRHQIRGILFYHTGRALSEETYAKHLCVMDEFGTHRSLPYRRLMHAIYNKELELEHY